MSTTSWIIFFICLFVFSLVLYKWKEIKAYFAKLFKSSNKKEKKSSKNKDKGENKNSSKLKSTEKQTRPVLKPPEEKKGEIKKEEVKDNSKNTVNEVKPIDYKLSTGTTKKTNTKELLNLKDDLDKEFEDIRKYLNMPEPINIKDAAVKKVSGNQVASPFSNNESFKTSVGSFSPYSANNFVKGVGRAGSTASDGKFPFNSRSGSNLNKNTFKSVEIGSKNNLPVSNFKPDLNYKNISQDLPYYNTKLNKNVENKVTIDGEEIDLNKLPLNIKRLIVSNILARKNYDD